MVDCKFFVFIILQRLIISSTIMIPSVLFLIGVNKTCLSESQRLPVFFLSLFLIIADAILTVADNGSRCFRSVFSTFRILSYIILLVFMFRLKDLNPERDCVGDSIGKKEDSKSFKSSLDIFIVLVFITIVYNISYLLEQIFHNEIEAVREECCPV